MAQRPVLTPEVLDSIKVLWRQPDTMALWGIPYEMRPGQSPRDLWESTRRPDTIRQAQGWHGATVVSPGPREGWIWLGQPGWWGAMTRWEMDIVQNWLRQTPMKPPNGPGEWMNV